MAQTLALVLRLALALVLALALALATRGRVDRRRSRVGGAKVCGWRHQFGLLLRLLRRVDKLAQLLLLLQDLLLLGLDFFQLALEMVLFHHQGGELGGRASVCNVEVLGLSGAGALALALAGDGQVVGAHVTIGGWRRSIRSN